MLGLRLAWTYDDVEISPEVQTINRLFFSSDIPVENRESRNINIVRAQSKCAYIDNRELLEIGVWVWKVQNISLILR